MGSARTGGSAIGVGLKQPMTGWDPTHYPHAVTQFELIYRRLPRQLSTPLLSKHEQDYWTNI